MRKIVAGLMMSVDGVVEAPETWTSPYFSPEIGQAVGSLMANGHTMLMGRVTYQTFAASFAGNTSDPMAAQMNAIPKVVSATLDQADWENSTLIRHDVPQVAWLLSQGLLDELNLLLFPIVVGHGKRLFGDEGPATALTVAHCESFGTGVAQLIYHPASNT